jgi:hypothetical protein
MIFARELAGLWPIPASSFLFILGSPGVIWLTPSVERGNETAVAGAEKRVFQATPAQFRLSIWRLMVNISSVATGRGIKRTFSPT